MTFGWQPAWKKDALELLDRLRKDDISVTIAELRRMTGWPKTKLETVLSWLEETGGLVRVDDAYYRRWRAVNDEDDQVAPAVFDNNAAELLAELTSTEL